MPVSTLRRELGSGDGGACRFSDPVGADSTEEVVSLIILEVATARKGDPTGGVNWNETALCLRAG